MGKTCQLQVRRLAGAVALLGLVLGVVVSRWFLVLVGFVGLNLIQSSFTDICPAEKFLPGCGTDERTDASPVGE
jgi:hypothetical protein